MERLGIEGKVPVPRVIGHSKVREAKGKEFPSCGCLWWIQQSFTPPSATTLESLVNSFPEMFYLGE